VEGSCKGGPKNKRKKLTRSSCGSKGVHRVNENHQGCNAVGGGKTPGKKKVGQKTSTWGGLSNKLPRVKRKNGQSHHTTTKKRD